MCFQGEHSFGFRITLIENLPSSFYWLWDNRNGYGNVGYYIKAKVIGQQFGMRKIIKFPCSPVLEAVKDKIENFRVKGKLDLNLHPKAKKKGKHKNS